MHIQLALAGDTLAEDLSKRDRCLYSSSALEINLDVSKLDLYGCLLQVASRLPPLWLDFG